MSDTRGAIKKLFVEIEKINARLAALEKDSHPPVNIAAVIYRILGKGMEDGQYTEQSQEQKASGRDIQSR